MTDWKAYDALVAEQQKEAEARRATPEYQAMIAEQSRRLEFMHDYVGAAPEHARGYYLGMTTTLVYAGQFAKTDLYSLDIDPEDFGYSYSPSGQQTHAESFYSGPPAPAPDVITHTFDPVLFLCVYHHWDDMGLIAWNFDLQEHELQPVGLRTTPMVTYSLKITCGCTESDTGVPDDFDWWYPWEERAAALRDKIAEIVVGTSQN